MSVPVSPKTGPIPPLVSADEKVLARASRIDSALSQHTIGGGVRSIPAKVKAWEISNTAQLVGASFNNSPPSATSTALEEYLQTIRQGGCKDKTQLFIVEQKHSRSTVTTDSGDFRTVLDYVQPFTSLNKTLAAFKIDDSDCYIGKADVHWSPPTQDGKLLELCCLLKYVEQNQRKVSSHPDGKHSFSEVQRWSLRQMAFYQRFDVSLNSESIVIVNNSAELFSTLKAACREGPEPLKPYRNWLRMPLLVFSSLPAQWSSYIAVLHKAVEEQKKNATFTDPQKKRIDEADNKSLEMCVELMDRLQSASHVLANNISILESALREATRRNGMLNQQKPSQDNSDQILFQSRVEDTIQELQFHRNQIELIIGRLERTTTTISNLISLRSSYNMERMTERSILEAKAVRIIALVTLLFLPPTFTSGFLDMDSLDITRSEGGHLIIDARPEFLFFLALTIPLMIVTVGGWLLWDWLSTRRRARLEEPSLLYP